MFVDGTARNDTQFWDAANDTFYFFEDNFSSCGFFKLPLSILRPDWAQQSDATWLNRSTVDGVEVTVELDDGDVIVVVQAADEDFSKGDQVRVLERSDGGVRVVQ